VRRGEKKVFVKISFSLVDDAVPCGKSCMAGDPIFIFLSEEKVVEASIFIGHISIKGKAATW